MYQAVCSAFTRFISFNPHQGGIVYKQQRAEVNVDHIALQTNHHHHLYYLFVTYPRFFPFSKLYSASISKAQTFLVGASEIV